MFNFCKKKTYKTDLHRYTEIDKIIYIKAYHNLFHFFNGTNYLTDSINIMLSKGLNVIMFRIFRRLLR